MRVQSINPFFELLGWDVNNKQGYAESYKDVYHEDAVSIKEATKAQDYAFRIKGGYQLIYDYLRGIPIRQLNFYNVEEKSKHDQMVGLVKRMLDLNKILAEAKNRA